MESNATTHQTLTACTCNGAVSGEGYGLYKWIKARRAWSHVINTTDLSDASRFILKHPLSRVSCRWCGFDIHHSSIPVPKK